MNTADKLRKLAEEVSERELKAYEKGHAKALDDLHDEFEERHENNPDLRMSIPSIRAVIRSHQRPTK